MNQGILVSCHRREETVCNASIILLLFEYVHRCPGRHNYWCDSLRNAKCPQCLHFLPDLHMLSNHRNRILTHLRKSHLLLVIPLPVSANYEQILVYNLKTHALLIQKPTYCNLFMDPHHYADLFHTSRYLRNGTCPFLQSY